MTANGTIDGTADRVRGRAYGCLFFVGFGSVWIFSGLASTNHMTRTLMLCAGAVCAVLLVATLLLLSRAKTLPAAPLYGEDALRAKLMFRAVNIIQWVSIATAIAILQLLHMPEYAVPAIAIIVGLHLFPLAGPFRNRQHYLTGWLLILWSLGCLASLSREEVAGITSLGTGAILLVSAAITLWRNFGAGVPRRA